LHAEGEEFPRCFEKKTANLASLAAMHPEAADMLEHMLHPDAGQRPTLLAVIMHPFWWPLARRQEFLQLSSDCWYEVVQSAGKKKEEQMRAAAPLERYLHNVVPSGDWEPSPAEAPGLAKNIKDYNKALRWTSLSDLYQTVRNKGHHPKGLPPGQHNTSGKEVAADCLEFFCKRHPRLMMVSFYFAMSHSQMHTHPALAPFWNGDSSALRLCSRRYLKFSGYFVED
jgi:hypothetical protein